MAILELNINELKNAPQVCTALAKVSKFQDVDIDYTFKVPSTMTYAEIEKHLNNFRCKLIWNHKLIDIYHNDNMGDISSWTFKFNICSLDKTLSSNDIDTFNFRILQHMGQIGLNI